jgi:hypothetical protein
LNSIGAIIVASFAVVWVVVGVRELKRPWFLGLSIASLLISTGIIVAATRLPFGKHSGGFDGRIYGIFVALEVVAIVCARILLNRFDAKQYLIPVIAFIVGAHFFGMVPALHSTDFWWVGGAMCVLPLVTIIAAPPRAWSPVVGIGCAVILWLSALRAFF